MNTEIIKPLQVKDSTVFNEWIDIDIQTSITVDVEDLFSKLSLIMQQPKTITFKYTTDYDNQGIVYWLGTKRGTSEWINPHQLESVAITAYPGLYEGSLDMFVSNQTTTRSYTHDDQNAHVVFDFRPSKVQIRPSAYTLGYASCSTYPRNWILQGSNDGSTWTTIKTHVADSGLDNDSYSHTWRIDGVQERYSMFKIKITGQTAHNNYYLVFCGLEMYGDVYQY
jgi:E3 ubiquitin-protein ligase HECTD1